MKEKLQVYIKENLEIEKRRSFNPIKKLASFTVCSDEFEECSVDNSSTPYYSNINTYIENNKNENEFQKLLFKYIDERNLTDSEVYNKVHIDRRLFSKIRTDNNYHPSKDTVILLGLSLELNEKEFIDLLNSAAYSLPKNNNYDLIIRFCFIEGIYKIKDVNELLGSYNCKLFSY